MWLVLCDDVDVPARWVHEGLRRRDVHAELVTASDLSRAVRWVHRLDSSDAFVEVTLADGRSISSAEVRVTLNRLLGVWPPTAYAHSPDSDYALQELLAMYVSLLWCLQGPVLNRSSAQGLSGPARYTLEWMVLAARAGFAVRPHTMSSRAQDTPTPERWPRHESPVRRVVVAAGRVFGEHLTGPAVASACRLADLAGTALLGINVAYTQNGTACFEGADLYPDLKAAGEELIDHIVTLADPQDRR